MFSISTANTMRKDRSQQRRKASLEPQILWKRPDDILSRYLLMEVSEAAQGQMITFWKWAHRVMFCTKDKIHLSHSSSYVLHILQSHWSFPAATCPLLHSRQEVNNNEGYRKNSVAVLISLWSWYKCFYSGTGSRYPQEKTLICCK